MQQSFDRRPVPAPAVIGLLLIVLGALALVLRASGVNLFATVGTHDWPFLVIVPGVVLLVASLVPAPPRGIGFAIAGGIVTTVGALLLYQFRTGDWDSWAYAWALIPLAAGAAIVLYGLFAREEGMITTGLTLASIAGGLFLFLGWFFEGIFAGEPRPADVGAWWPVGAIVLGGVFVLRALLLPPPRSSSFGESAGPARVTDRAHDA